MNSELKWPDNLFQLIVSGESTEIFQSIQHSADLCVADLKKSLAEKEMETAAGEEIQSHVKEGLDDAGEVKFSLSKVDNSIKKESQTNIILRRFLQAQKSMTDSPLSLFFDVLSSDDKDDFFAKNESLNHFRSMVVESFRFRIQFTSCWDSILLQHRRVLVSSATLTGHRLSAIALQMQDDETIQQVRDLLDQLDLQIPQETRFFSLPRKLDELQTLLIQGIQTIEQQYQKIVLIDKHRKEIRETHEKLENVTDDDIEFESQDNSPKPKIIKEKGNVSRMIYPHQLRDSGKGPKK